MILSYANGVNLLHLDRYACSVQVVLGFFGVIYHDEVSCDVSPPLSKIYTHMFFISVDTVSYFNFRAPLKR